MKTTFTARHIRLHPRLREIVETKLAKLERTLPGDAEAHVVVTAGKKDVEVEVTVAGRHGTLTAAARAGDQPSAAQDVMDRIAAQAVKIEDEGEAASRNAPPQRSGTPRPGRRSRRPRWRVTPDPGAKPSRRARCSRRTPSPRSPPRGGRSSFSATRPPTTPCAFCTGAATGRSAWSSPSRRGDTMTDPAETKPLVRAGDLRSPALASLGLELVAGTRGSIGPSTGRACRSPASPSRASWTT